MVCSFSYTSVLLTGLGVITVALNLSLASLNLRQAALSHGWSNHQSTSPLKYLF